LQGSQRIEARLRGARETHRSPKSLLICFEICIPHHDLFKVSTDGRS
jgi:hypothetical protein